MLPTSKLTRDVAEAIFALLRRGHYIEGAAAHCGIHRDTLHRWRQEGGKAREHERNQPARDDFADDETFEAALKAWRLRRRQLKPYLDFLDGFELAMDFGESWLMEQILEAADPSTKQTYQKRWQAYMTILERSRRDRWSRRSITEHGTLDGKPLQVSHSFDPAKLSDEELETLQRLLAQAQPSDS